MFNLSITLVEDSRAEVKVIAENRQWRVDKMLFSLALHNPGIRMHGDDSTQHSGMT